MIKEAFGTGATVQDAYKAAREALNAPDTADVKFETVEQPKNKFFGLLGKTPAKVRAYYEIPDAPAAKKEKPATPAKEKPIKKEKPVENKKPAKVEKPKQEKPAKATKAEETKAQEPAPDLTECANVAVDYIVSIVKGMGIENVSATYTQNGTDIMVELDCGDDYGAVIGRRGETLDSLQYLARLAANKVTKNFFRISINVGNYREKREKTLRELAAKNSARVLKYGRNFTFEPMNPYERRIIHTAIQEIEGVSSYSVGSDTERRVVITLAEGVKPTHPSSGNSRGGRGGNRGGRSGRGYNKPKSEPIQSPKREPRTDDGAQKVSLYGKIN